jgi:hypothetical protein
MTLFCGKLAVGFILILILNWIWQKLKAQLLLRRNPLSTREKLLYVALSDLDWLLIAMSVFAISGEVAWLGGLTGPQGLLNSDGEVPTFVLWLLDPTFLSMAGSFVVGSLFGYFTRSFGFSILLSIALLFPDMIAVPTAVVLIFGEVTGASFRRHRNMGRHAAFLRTLVAVISFVTFWICGAAFRDIFQSMDWNPMQVGDRIRESLVLISCLCAMDTFLSMLAFHFYFHWTRLD